MAKAKTNISTLIHTRLVKLKVERILRPEDASNGSISLQYGATVGTITDNNKLAIVTASVAGDSRTGEGNEEKIVFVIDAAIEGIFEFQHEINPDTFKGNEVSLAQYLLPIIVDIVESNVSKMGYTGVVLPRSYPVPIK